MTEKLKYEVGVGLRSELDKGYDIVRISQWAYSMNLAQGRRLDKEIHDRLLELVAMEQGLEFELTEEELREISRSCIETAGQET